MVTASFHNYTCFFHPEIVNKTLWKMAVNFGGLEINDHAIISLVNDPLNRKP